jgi:hypothetical protein
VTPLRQIASASPGSAVQLYAPEAAYRLYYPDQADTRRPVGQNPPAGALIDYYFASKPAGEVTIDILDTDGKLVRHLSSKTGGTAEQPPEWPDQIIPTSTLPAYQGMNRFVWNLRYDDPVQIPGAFYEGLAPRGPIALPGRYTVKLTVDGQSQTASLDLVRDPRVSGPDDGLRQKFALSTETWHDLDTLHRAVNDIRAVKAQVASLHKKYDGKPAAASVLAEGDGVVAKTTPIEGTLMAVDIKGSEGNLNYPDMINEQIYAFAAGLEDADTAPTKQEVETYADLHAQLQAQLDAWSKLKNEDVAAFRTHLDQAGM